MLIALFYKVYSYILTGLAELTEPNPPTRELKTQHVEDCTHMHILFFCRLRLLEYDGFCASFFGRLPRVTTIVGTLVTLYIGN